MKIRIITSANITALILTLFLFGCGSGTNENLKEQQTEASDPDEEIESTELPPFLNFNLAGEDELIRLPGMSQELASMLIEGRPYLDMTTLHSLLSDQMDEETLNSIYAEAFVPMDLNTTPKDDFKLIPGVGDRMAHEFEEYRPYTSIEQFRREIGKYVEETEVARYEQYVFVPVELNSGSKEEILAIPGVGERMLHEFEEYRPYTSMEQFRKEIGKYVDDDELARLERYVYLEK